MKTWFGDICLDCFRLRFWNRRGGHGVRCKKHRSTLPPRIMGTKPDGIWIDEVAP